MQDWATSIDSSSSGVRVPSLSEVERKSIIARARRFFESEVDALRKGRLLVRHESGEGMVCEKAYHDGVEIFLKLYSMA